VRCWLREPCLALAARQRQAASEVEAERARLRGCCAPLKTFGLALRSAWPCVVGTRACARVGWGR
jgi:hypothetical protein